MKSRWLVMCLAGLCCVQVAWADVIVLRNGEHVEGQITDETAKDVSIRRTNKSGSIRYVDKISRADIQRIERAATQPADGAPQATESTATQPSAEPSLPTGKIADKPAFLDTAIKKFIKPDYAGAGADLTRLINNSTPEEREQLSDIVKGHFDTTLAQLAAMAHFQAAMDRAKGRAVKFQYVTDYEKPALIPLITEAYEKALDAEVSVPGGHEEKEKGEKAERNEGKDRSKAGDSKNARPSDNPGNSATPRNGRSTRADRRRSRTTQRPARRASKENEDGEDGEDDDKGHEGKDDDREPTSRPSMTIRGWMDHPKDFDGNRRESLAMSVMIYHAKSLLSERILLDPALKTSADLRAQLAVDRGKLDALLKAVLARGRGAQTPAEREAQEAEYRNRIDAAQREAWRQQQAGWGDLRRLMEEQERQRQMMPQPGGGGNQAPAPAPRQ